jgi:hypothetical protein
MYERVDTEIFINVFNTIILFEKYEAHKKKKKIYIQFKYYRICYLSVQKIYNTLMIRDNNY